VELRQVDAVFARFLSKGGFAMLIVVTISILFGIALGLRFKFLILVPTIGASLATVAINGILRGEANWRLVVTMVVVATFLQLGYVAGCVLRFAAGAVSAEGPRRASMPTSAGVSKTSA
jgi:hypothetical protein